MQRRKDVETVVWCLIEAHPDDALEYLRTRIDGARADRDDDMVAMWREVLEGVTVRLGERAKRTD